MTSGPTKIGDISSKSTFMDSSHTIPGATAACTTYSALGLAWVTENALPWLHVISLIIGIAAGITTALYYFVEWRTACKHRAAYYSYIASKRKAKKAKRK